MTTTTTNTNTYYPVWSLYRCEICEPVEQTVMQTSPDIRILGGTRGTIKNPPLCPYIFVRINGKLYNRSKRFSSSSLRFLKRFEDEYNKIDSDQYRQNILIPRCVGCGIPYGQVHHIGCTNEQCPKCGNQFIECGCGPSKGVHYTERKIEADGEFFRPIKIFFESMGNNKVEFLTEKDISLEEQKGALSLPKKSSQYNTDKNGWWCNYEQILTCPQCGESNFFMYREDYIIPGQRFELTNSPVTEMAECLNCSCKTCAFALKHEYNKEDMSKDFPIAMKETLALMFECERCDKYKFFIDDIIEEREGSDVEEEDISLLLPTYEATHYMYTLYDDWPEYPDITEIILELKKKGKSLQCPKCHLDDKLDVWFDPIDQSRVYFY
jgi:hypothetical protein